MKREGYNGFIEQEINLLQFRTFNCGIIENKYQ